MSQEKTESQKEKIPLDERVKEQILEILPQAFKKIFGITEPQAKYEFLINPDNKKALGILTSGQVEAVYMAYALEEIYGVDSQRRIMEHLLDANKGFQGKGIQALINFEKASHTTELPIGLVTAPRLETEQKKKRFWKRKQKAEEGR